jgi:hypothetical protein
MPAAWYGRPGYAQALRIGGPAVVGGRVRIEVVVAVVGRRSAGGAQRVVVAGEQEQAVGVGAGLGGAVVMVTDREGACEGELERHVGLGIVAHRMVLLDRAPVVHAAVIPGELRVRPGVRRAGHPQHRKVLHGIQAERRDGAALGPVGPARHRGAADGLLHEDRFAAEQVLPVLHRNREGIAESPHPFHGAEIMVEAAVFLGQHDDVLDVLQTAGALVGGQGQRPLDGRWKSRQHGTGTAGVGHRAEKVTTAHASTLVRENARSKICMVCIQVGCGGIARTDFQHGPA